MAEPIGRRALSYTLEGRKLSFGPIVSTVMACVKGMEVETAFGAVFSRVDGYQLSGGTLSLTAGGSTLAKFEAAGAP